LKLYVNCRLQTGAEAGVQGGNTIDALIFGFLVNVVEIPKDFDRGNMRPRIIDHSLRPILHQKLKQH